MIATTIFLLASIVQADRPELLLEPREMEVLPAPREVPLPNPYVTPELRPERLSISLRELERLSGPYSYTPSYDPFKKTNEEREKSEKMMRVLKKFEEYNAGLAKRSRQQSVRKLETFGIVIVLAVFFTILRGAFALGAASGKSTSTNSPSERAYPEWMDDETDKKEKR